MIEDELAALNNQEHFLATKSTSVEIYDFVVRLLRVMMIFFDKVDTLLIARGATPDLRRVCAGVGCMIMDFELVATTAAPVMCRVRIRVTDALRAVRMTSTTGE